MALCLGTYGDPRGVGISYEGGAPLRERVREVQFEDPEQVLEGAEQVAVSAHLTPYSPNRRLIRPTDALSRMPPCPANCCSIRPTAALAAQLPPYPTNCPLLLPSAASPFPPNCGRSHPTAALSCQLPPYPPNCTPILPTANCRVQLPPYPPNRRPIHPTDALSTQPTASCVQGYLAHQKAPTPLGPP